MIYQAHLDRKPFMAALKRISAARGTDKALPLLSGVQFHLRPEGLRLAATDRYILAFTDLPYLEPAESREDSFVVYPDELKRVLASPPRGGPVVIEIHPEGVAVIDGVRIVRDGTDTEYPKVTAIVQQRIDRANNDQLGQFVCDPKKLAQLAKTFPQGSVTAHSVRANTSGRADAMVFTSEREPGYFGVLMGLNEAGTPLSEVVFLP